MVGKIYVGNLPWGATEEDIKVHFEQGGAVHSVTIVKDRLTGRSRGFGFVEMENADQAITSMDGSSFQGRNLKVSSARQNDRPAGGGHDR